MCEKKCEKTNYNYSMRNDLNAHAGSNGERSCNWLILIDTCAMSHFHDDSKEMFRRGLSVRVQESIRE
jgi:hypothetical protein